MQKGEEGIIAILRNKSKLLFLLKNLCVTIPCVITFLTYVSISYAKSVTCFIPLNDAKDSAVSTDYIKLKEPKTLIEFNMNYLVEKFHSPGCNKFNNISYWDQTLVMECESNGGEFIKLKLNMRNQSFIKTYSKLNKKSYTYEGRCSSLKN